MRTFCAIIVVTSAVLLGAQRPPRMMIEWTHTGSALTQTKYSTPSPFSATPMTYRTKSGRQFVVVATDSGPDAVLVGFALRPQ